MKKILKEFTKGIASENPIFRLVLGLCPALAVSTSLVNALGMGLAATFVLVCSNTIISLTRKIIPDRVRLPAFIVIIATFVTICDMLMKAYFPALNKSLGIFVPLIVVNCMILARAETFASKNNILYSFIDGLGMGIGFTIAICAVALVREFLGAASIFEVKLISGINPMTVMVLAPGALLTLGLLIALINLMRIKKGKSALKKGCSS
ncbi:MAG: electron transport complex subunit E [Candidatus Gygaella obscura]|nr:electron transport complex subunit E [Candidatus Gygaella obscura]